MIREGSRNGSIGGGSPTLVGGEGVRPCVRGQDLSDSRGVLKEETTIKDRKYKGRY